MPRILDVHYTKGKVGPWITITPVVSPTGLSNNVGEYRQVGDSYEVRGSFSATASGGGFMSIGIPNAGVIDTTKLSIPANTTAAAGSWIGEMFENTASSVYGMIPLVACPGTSTVLIYAGARSSVALNLTPEAAANFFQASTIFSYKFTVPIVGLSATL